jgi:hypothetical protein
MTGSLTSCAGCEAASRNRLVVCAKHGFDPSTNRPRLREFALSPTLGMSSEMRAVLNLLRERGDLDTHTLDILTGPTTEANFLQGVDLPSLVDGLAEYFPDRSRSIFSCRLCSRTFRTEHGRSRHQKEYHR